MQTKIDRLEQNRALSTEEYKELLTTTDAAAVRQLHRVAGEVARRNFGNKIWVRGLIEVSSYCRNNCYYCGIRAGNSQAERYRLGKEDILRCCQTGYALGLRTFVMQGGEDPVQNVSWWEDVVASIRKRYPDCAITLSLGEMPEEDYQRLFNAGANRYLLRHETRNLQHYASLHPASMSAEHRLHCLHSLKAIGYQTGTGIMVGSPGQTIEHLLEDIEFIKALHPQMIGIGPFIPHKDTPFAKYAAGSLDLTLRLISLFRLLHPQALIPATTALATLSPYGRLLGIQAGANVVMPNLSPPVQRRKYALYNDKAVLGAEAAEGLALLQAELETIGYTISFERGDYIPTPSDNS